MISPIYPQAGDSPWDVTIDGIYDSRGRDRQDAVLLHYEYMNETLRAAKTPLSDISAGTS